MVDLGREPSRQVTDLPIGDPGWRMTVPADDPSREVVGSILVVEDDALIAEVVEEALRDVGYEVVAAGSGEAAMRALQAGRPDLVLLDLTLPDVDGLDLVRQLRADPRWNSVPVIALTARDQVKDRILGLREGLDDYLTKPFSLTELTARVEANVRRSKRELHTSPLTLLPGNRSIEVALGSRLALGQDFAVCYLDFNNFKPFNDRYGFVAGDQVIRAFAEIIQDTVAVTREGFPGHIGGDDFIVVLDPDEAEPFAKSVIERFEALLPHIYTPEDFQRGAMEAEDRVGERRTFPLLGISIAVVVQEGGRYSHVGELSRAAAEVKSFLKTRDGKSCYMIDRRHIKPGG